MDNTDEDAEISTDISKLFKNNPTLENYVALRRGNPTSVIEVGISGGIEWLFENDTVLRTLNIEPILVASALDADENAISELSLVLMELLIERDRANKSGKTHVVSRGQAISDTLVRCLTNMILDSLSWNNYLYIPRDLIVLIRYQIGCGETDWQKQEKKKDFMSKAFIAGIELFVQGKKPTYRAIAKKLGVNVTTVTRCYSNNDSIEMLQQAYHSYTSGTEMSPCSFDEHLKIWPTDGELFENFITPNL